MAVFIVSKFHLELIKGKQLRQKREREREREGKKKLGLKNIFTIRKITRNGN